MTAATGSFVLAVAEAAATARAGTLVRFTYGGDTVLISHHIQIGYVVTSDTLFTDGHLAARVEALLRHG